MLLILCKASHCRKKADPKANKSNSNARFKLGRTKESSSPWLHLYSRHITRVQVVTTPDNGCPGFKYLTSSASLNVCILALLRSRSWRKANRQLLLPVELENSLFVVERADAVRFIYFECNSKEIRKNLLDRLRLFLLASKLLELQRSRWILYKLPSFPELVYLCILCDVHKMVLIPNRG